MSLGSKGHLQLGQGDLSFGEEVFFVKERVLGGGLGLKGTVHGLGSGGDTLAECGDMFTGG